MLMLMSDPWTESLVVDAGGAGAARVGRSASAGAGSLGSSAAMGAGLTMGRGAVLTVNPRGRMSSRGERGIRARTMGG